MTENDTDANEIEERGSTVDSDGSIVIVESSQGPQFGYYHKESKGTWMGPQEMTRGEAEQEGYSPCTHCFRSDDDK